MNEKYYDRLLYIKTAGEQLGFHDSFHFHRYEPTPYNDLLTLFETYKLGEGDSVVDFGCGKGRLNFFISYLFDVPVLGVEMDESFYEEAIENRRRYLEEYEATAAIEFVCCMAQDYPIKATENIFYFFNPFSVQIFMKVINNIMRSVEKHRRDVDVILYYPSEDYIYFLENQSPFELVKEVQLPAMSDLQVNERFLIYRLSY